MHTPPTVSDRADSASGDASAQLTNRFRTVLATWEHWQQRIIVLAAELADGVEWALDGSPNAAHWISDAAGVERSTAREWIRIGRKLRELPKMAAAFADGRLSYSKVRTLTRVATSETEDELVDLATGVAASDLGQAIAVWMTRTHSPKEIAAYQHEQRSVTWRTRPDGMVEFTLRLPPLLAARLIAVLTVLLMRTTLNPARATVAQQHADNLAVLLDQTAGPTDVEIVLHVRGDGCTLDDGSPIPQTVVESIADAAFIRALIHDADGRPIDATNRRRHPTRRQQRLVRERDRACVDCGRTDLLEYDHVPPHCETGHTLTSELELRCAPCHDRRHQHHN